MKHCTTCQHLFPDVLQVCPTDNVPLRIAREVEPGMVIRGKYIVLEWIGAGGMAAVYRARHRLLNEMRAVKVVSSRFASDQDFLKRFRHEAAVARRLRHENAVWVEDLDELEDGRPFIAMEFLQGDDLRKLIQGQGPLAVERSLNLGAQVGAALSAAHKLGIVHRDIKPDNIFITRDAAGNEIAKVLDFGIAKAKESALQDGYTATGTGVIIGTPEYMSPEQAEGRIGSDLDGRSDVYSLGVVLYEMLTGQLPFKSDTPLGMCLHHLQTVPRPPHELRPDLRIPENISALLMKALEKRRDRRFQSADEMVVALRHPPESRVVNHDGAVAPTRVSGPATSKRSSEEPTAALAQSQAAAAQMAAPRPVSSAESHASAAQKHTQRWRILTVAAAVIFCVAAGYLLLNAVQRRNAALQAHDLLVREQVLERFRSSPALQGRAKDIVVTVNSDTVTLGGSVPSPGDRDKADSEARTVPGVSNVINGIVVAGLAGVETHSRPATLAAPESTDQHESSASNPPKRQPGSAAVLHSENVRKANELVRLGKAAADDGNYPVAFEDFQKALKLDPQNSAASDAWKNAKGAEKAEQEVFGKKRR